MDLQVCISMPDSNLYMLEVNEFQETIKTADTMENKMIDIHSHIVFDNAMMDHEKIVEALLKRSACRCSDYRFNYKVSEHQKIKCC